MPRQTHDMFACICYECGRKQRAMLKEWRAMQHDSVSMHPMTQGQAAAEFGIHERTWRRYENGELDLPLWLLRQFERMQRGKR